MRPIAVLPLLLAAFIALFASPSSAQAQSVGELMASMQRGGGWVSVPIENGTGHVSTATLPTVGLTVAGCVHVWAGHTGRWDIQARDALGAGRLQMEAGAGESVPFTYTAGMRSQLEVDFSWSEARDTTLFLWVGLARPNQDPASTCEPIDG
ncbi:MAG: hypothetical protein WD995_06000 [Gemmatimonadota bacterium]